MPDITITISTIEQKLFEAYRIDPQAWADNAVLHKAGRLADRIILALTASNPAKLSQAEKIAVLTDLYNQGLLGPGSMNPPINVPY